MPRLAIRFLLGCRNTDPFYMMLCPNLPKPTFLWVLIINPNIDFIGTLQKSRFWRVKVRIGASGV